jgi:tripartite-type tricarboxylate transporter receptor subunit TctC
VTNTSRMFGSAAGLLLGIASVASMAQGGPGTSATERARPIRWVVPQPPGTASDTMARTIAQKLSEQWSRPIVIDNRTGANGIIGADAVAKSAPNGLTWLNAYVGNHATNPALHKNLPFDAVKDFAAVAMLGVVPYVLVVNPGLPVKNVKDLIELARHKPGELTYGGPTGSMNQLMGVMLNASTGVKMLFVPYKVMRDATLDTVAGRIHSCYSSAVVSVPLVKSGKLRALATTSGRRTESLPDVPTIAESGFPGFDVTPWFGILVRAGTPPTTINEINSAVNSLLGQKDVADKFAGAEPNPLTPQAFEKIIRDDMVRWGKVIKDAGVVAE